MNTDGEREVSCESEASEGEKRGRIQEQKVSKSTSETRMSDSRSCPLVACAGGPKSWEKHVRSDEGLRAKRLVLPMQAILSRYAREGLLVQHGRTNFRLKWKGRSDRV